MPYTDDITNWMMVFTRATGLLAVFPIFSSRNFPTRIRLALGAFVAFMIAPGLPAADVAHLSLFGLLVMMLKELAVGLLLGYVSRMLFFALDVTGALVTQEMGLNMGNTLNPFSEAHSDAPGTILYYLAAVMFLALDMHHWLLLGFQKTFQILPPGGGHVGTALMADVVKRTSGMFVAAVQMAAPMISVSFLITLVFSVLGRAVPQMNVFNESFAFRGLAGLAVFGLTLNLMAQHMSNYLRRLPEDVVRVAHLLST